MLSVGLGWRAKNTAWLLGEGCSVPRRAWLTGLECTSDACLGTSGCGRMDWVGEDESCSICGRYRWCQRELLAGRFKDRWVTIREMPYTFLNNNYPNSGREGTLTRRISVDVDLRDSQHKSRCSDWAKRGRELCLALSGSDGLFGGIMSYLLPPAHNSVFPSVGKRTVPAVSSFTGGCLESLSF